MKKYRLAVAVLLVFFLFSLLSCAPYKLQGEFSASFSLTACSESDNKYQYEFYGDGQGIEKNTVTGATVSFTYSVLNDSITINADQGSFVYKYETKDEKDLNFNYQEDGTSKDVLLVRK